MNHTTRTVFCLVTTVSASATCLADVIYVNAAAAPGGDGTTWATAANNLFDALLTASAGDDLWVASGTYTPDGPGGEQTRSFWIDDDVSVYGGFAGDEVTLAERDWERHPTLLSGDLNGDDASGERIDNSLRVIHAHSSLLDGVVVTGGNGAANGGGVLFSNDALTIRNCVFRNNVAGNGGGVFGMDGRLVVENTTFLNNEAGTHGGGLRLRFCTEAILRDCHFNDNNADVGAGLAFENMGASVLEDCTFTGNVVFGGAAGGLIYESESIEVTRCRFRFNDGGLGGAGFVTDGTTTSYRDCFFAANFGLFNAGGVGDASDELSFVNCVFSRNRADFGAAIVTGAQTTTIVGCTFSNHSGDVIQTDTGLTTIIENSIFWGTDGTWFTGTQPQVTYSNVQGGYSGTGNIDSDPLLVQANSDNVRLSFGSPCANAGSNDLVPDGVKTDIDGSPRIQEGTVDMGAYEGQFAPEPPGALAGDLDEGDVFILVPDGITFDPLAAAAVVVRNFTGGGDAMMSVLQLDGTHPEAGGYYERASVLDIDTSMEDGTFYATVFLPFTSADLGGVDPLLMDLTTYAPTTGTWALGVSGNDGDSPGHPRAIGDRSAKVGPGPWGLTTDLGDYGVYWDTEVERGFVWANVDHAGAFGVGEPRCASDCTQPPDGMVNGADLLYVLTTWGEGAGPFDVTNDGIVAWQDLMAVLMRWGSCPLP